MSSYCAFRLTVNEPGHRGTLHEFFPTVVLDPPKARRLLDAPTPSPRKKALKNGRTNAPVPFARPEAAKSDLLRRIRPRGLAVVHPPRRTVTIPAAPGVRELRDVPLTVEDLWQGSHGGPPHVDDVPEEDCCSICLQLVSHPVL
jgi:hypothetical protein